VETATCAESVCVGPAGVGVPLLWAVRCDRHESVITSLAGFGSPESVITSLAGFDEMGWPQVVAAWTGIPAAFR
jgi:hypothetical protein